MKSIPERIKKLEDENAYFKEHSFQEGSTMHIKYLGNFNRISELMILIKSLKAEREKLQKECEEYEDKFKEYKNQLYLQNYTIIQGRIAQLTELIGDDKNGNV